MYSGIILEIFDKEILSLSSFEFFSESYSFKLNELSLEFIFILLKSSMFLFIIYFPFSSKLRVVFNPNLLIFVMRLLAVIFLLISNSLNRI